MTASHFYHIDIAAGCNLRCPSCPSGNSPKVPRPKGLMPVELYGEIIEKARSEAPRRKPGVGLFNWTEPFLHPQLPEFVRIARRQQIPVDVSTNLNISRNLDEVIRAEPTHFRISVSGFSQEAYSRTHVKGSIETVKANMKILRAALDRHGSTTKVQVVYLCYVDNVGTEYDNMLALCRGLGFQFAPLWAYLMPMEKCLEHYEKGLAGEDRRLLNLLAVDPDQAKAISLRHMSKDCGLRSGRTAINCDGSVALCCTVYDARHNIAKSFLETKHEDLRKAKYAHPLCKKCMTHGIFVTMLRRGMSEWNAVAEKRLYPRRIPKELVGRTFVKRLVQKMLRRLRPGRRRT